MANNAIKQARKIKKEVDGKVTYDSLCRIACDRGICVLYYSEAQELIERLKVTEKARKSRAFLYRSDLTRFIFVEDGHPDKLYLLAHELGHYVLGHDGNSTPEQELEADQFAKALFTDNNYKPLAVALSIVAIVGIITGFMLSADRGEAPAQTVRQQPTTTDTTGAASTENDDQEQIYIVTRTGDKYHLPDCQYVRNKTDVLEITLDDAISMGYEPCKVCIGE